MALFSSDNPHYRYNRKTLKYERIDNTVGYQLKRLLKVATLGIIIGAGTFILLITFIPSPAQKRLADRKSVV